MKVVVVGAGIVGAACARALSRAGLQTVVIDRGSAACGTSAACEGNLLVSDKTPGPELDLALAAVRRWTETAAELLDELGPAAPDLELLHKGGLVVSRTDGGAVALRSFTAGQRASGVRVDDLTPADAHSMEPALAPDVTGAAHYPQDAQLQPTAAAEALLASARRAGAVVHTHERVTGLLRRADGSVRAVRTERGHHEADLVLNAAGPWAGELAAALGAPLPVLPRRGMVLVTTRMPQVVRHKVYDADYVGATQSGDADLQTSTVVESTPAGTILIGSSRERVGFDDRIDVDVAAELAAKAVALFPFLREAQLLRAYVGFRPYLPDHLPVIGPDPRVPGLLHATGHEGAGIGLSVVTADLVAALVTGADPVLDPTPFAADRPSLAPHLEVVA